MQACLAGKSQSSECGETRLRTALYATPSAPSVTCITKKQLMNAFYIQSPTLQFSVLAKVQALPCRDYLLDCALPA